jgi:hypothetical protein
MAATSGFSIREYQQGDAVTINDLYYRVTGRTRSELEYEWQWLSAPAGQGSIHLIHFINDKNQSPILIGHHGIMPLRFTNGIYDAVAGKTENTMVDPAYRGDIVYPRYESHFKAQYSNKYDALFSTIGPPAAIRQRLAHGYIEVGTWESFILSARKACLNNESKVPDASGQCLDLVPLSKKSLEDYDFTSFWRSCKFQYPFTPSREKIDLEWRFLRNPYHSYLIAVLTSRSSASGIAGFAVIRLHSKTRRIPVIEDIVVRDPSLHSFKLFLGKVMCALLKRGFTHASLPFVLDGSIQSQSLFEGAALYVSNLSQLGPLLRGIFIKSKVASRRPGMMRWINPDACKSILIDQWYVTGMVLEGR